MTSFISEVASDATKLEQKAKEPTAQTATNSIEGYVLRFWETRFNEVLSCIEFSEKKQNNWKRLTDRDANSMLRQMRNDHVECSATKFDETLNSDFSPAFNPFASYFDSLPPYSNSPIAELAKTIALSNPDEQQLFEQMLKKWLVATVACSLDSNPNETALILIGEQGTGKSRWLRRLVPQSLNEYQYTGLIKADDKDSKTNLAECFLINLDELATLRKNDIESLKSLFSEKAIRVRRAYARRAETLQRRASFVGSDNTDSFLNDPTGNRRFLVFEVAECNHQHTININEVYSEALHLYKQGFEYWLSSEEIKLVNARNEAYAVVTAEQELVEKHISISDNPKSYQTTTDVLSYINSQEENIKLKETQSTLRKIGAALKSIGCKKTSKRIGGKPRGVWQCRLGA